MQKQNLQDFLTLLKTKVDDLVNKTVDSNHL